MIAPMSFDATEGHHPSAPETASSPTPLLGHWALVSAVISGLAVIAVGVGVEGLLHTLGGAHLLPGG